LNLNGVDGYERMDEGAENLPKLSICFASGTWTDGGGLRDTTTVALMVVEPVPSVAMMSTGWPTTSPLVTSEALGVPYRRRVLLSIDSQLGWLPSEYVILEPEVKVYGEKE